MPIGAIVGTPAVWRIFQEQPLIHSSTFGGNPLACAAALASVRAILEGNLAAQAQIKGVRLMRLIQGVAEKHPRLIGAVRGRGLLVGIEFAEEDLGALAVAGLASRGILVAYSLNNPRVIRAEPPLIVSDEQIDDFVAALAGTCEHIEALLPPSA